MYTKTTYEVRKARQEIASDLVTWRSENSDVNLMMASVTAHHRKESEFFTWCIRFLTKSPLTRKSL